MLPVLVANIFIFQSKFQSFTAALLKNKIAQVLFSILPTVSFHTNSILSPYEITFCQKNKRA